MRRIKSLRDAEDVVTLLLQVLVIRGRRSAREGQAHILRFSPTTTIPFYCKLHNHGVLMTLSVRRCCCSHAASPLLSLRTPAGAGLLGRLPALWHIAAQLQ